MRISCSRIHQSRAPCDGIKVPGLSSHALSGLLVCCILLGAPFSIAHGQFQFVEVTGEANLSGYTMLAGKGGGVAAADFDDDGDIDLFAPTAGGVPNRLYRNDGGTFAEIAGSVGLASLDPSRSALWFDYDGDHRLDLVVGGDCHSLADVESNSPAPCADTLSLHLYRQLAGGQFVDVTATADISTGLITDSFRHRGGISAGDLNNDGYLDLLIAIWQQGARVLLNDGDGTFTDITDSSGVGFEFPRNYYQHVVHDFNGDGYLDFFTARDSGRNHLWVNQQDNTFVNRGEEAEIDSFWNEMGTVLGDYDNDGDFDIFVTNIEAPFGLIFRHHVLYENQSVGETLNFEDVSLAAGVAVEEGEVWQVGWGCTFFDGDNDGLLDLAVANGMNSAAFPWATTDQSVFFRNQGGSPTTFSNVSNSVGFNDTLIGSSLVAVDYDRDGRLDLVQTVESTEAVNGEVSRIRLLHNEATEKAASENYLVVKPRIPGPNHRAIGAVIRVEVDGVTMSRLITAGTSFIGQEPAEAHFGLGAAINADSVIIEWPDGNVTEFEDMPTNQILTVNNTQAVGTRDSDHDGLTDLDEVNIHGTHPNDSDTDGDGASDGHEVIFGSDPLNPGSTAELDAQSTRGILLAIMLVVGLFALHRGRGDNRHGKRVG